MSRPAKGFVTNVLVVSLCISLASHLCGQTPNRNAKEPGYPSEQSTGQQLLETVTGTTISQNRTYSLSFDPAQQYPVRAFQNHVRMTPGIGYTIHGKTITVSSEISVMGVDVFQFAYIVDVTPHAAAESGASNDRSNREPLSRFLDSALADQLTYLPAQSAPHTLEQATLVLKRAPVLVHEQTTGPCTTTSSSDPFASAVIESSDQAFRMLAESISDNRGTRPKSAKAHGHQAETDGATGIEGLGDAPLSGELFNLAMTQPDLTRARKMTPGANTPCQRGLSDNPMIKSTALRLLLQNANNSR